MVLAERSGYTRLLAVPQECQLDEVKAQLEPILWEGEQTAPASQAQAAGGPREGRAEALGTAVTPGASSRTASPSASPRKKPGRAPSRLDIDDRLELEALVTPQLTLDVLQRVATRAGLRLSLVADKPVGLGWGLLVQEALHRHALIDLLKALCFSFPELREEALIQRLLRA